MLCHKCGQQSLDSAKFCLNCGEKLVRTGSQNPASGGTSPSASPSDLRGDTLRGTPNYQNAKSFDPLRSGQTVWSGAVSQGTLLAAGRFALERRLGSGAMGEVWLAQDHTLDRKVAIKLLPSDVARNPRAIAALKKEASLLLELTHPHICRLYDFTQHDDVAFLSMEWINGETLEQRLDACDGRRMSLEEAMPIFRAVADALNVAHMRTPPILHRDIKPANIMLTASSEAKLMDFGIACELRDTMTRFTGHEPSGTRLYMSPEQLRGKTLTPASDVYSLAASMYECLCGHPPFHRGDIPHQLLNEPVPSPEELGVELPQHIESALLKALAKEPLDRFPAATDWLKTMESCSPALPPVQPLNVHGTPGDRRIVVAPSGEADFGLIQHAIDQATPGDAIYIRPGVYREKLIIDKPLHLYGDGPVADVVLECLDDFSLWLKYDSITVRGLSFRQNSAVDESHKNVAIRVTASEVSIENCDIQASGSCLHVNGTTANVSIKECRIHGIAGNVGAIVVETQAKAAIGGCSIYGEQYVGVRVKTGGEVRLANSKIYDVFNGIEVYDNSKANIDTCEIYGNKREGVSVEARGEVTVTNTEIHDCGGINVREGKANIEYCKIYGIKSSGVWVSEGGNVIIKKSKIHNCEKSGMFILEGANVDVNDCEFYDNRQQGIFVYDDGKVALMNSRVRNNADDGVVVTGNGKVDITGCAIYGNKGIGVNGCANPGRGVCEITILKSKIRDNASEGVSIGHVGKASIESCEITHNGGHGVHFGYKTLGHVKDCDLRHNKTPYRLVDGCDVTRKNNTC